MRVTVCAYVEIDHLRHVPTVWASVLNLRVMFCCATGPLDHRHVPIFLKTAKYDSEASALVRPMRAPHSYRFASPIVSKQRIARFPRLQPSVLSRVHLSTTHVCCDGVSE